MESSKLNSNIWNMFIWKIFIFIFIVEGREIQILWFAPEKSTPENKFNASSSIGAFALALERIERENLLPNITIRINWLDSECNGKQSIGLLSDFLSVANVDVIFGPPCTESMTAVADLASYKDIPVFGWMSNKLVLDNKKRYSTLIRLQPALTSLGYLLLLFFEEMSWFKFTMMSSDTYATNIISNSILFTITQYKENEFTLIRYYSKINISTPYTNITDILNSAKIISRVIVLVIPKELLRDYMLLAYELGMTNGEFQFVYIEQQTSDFDELDWINSTSLWQRNDLNDNAARQAFENVLYVSFTYIVEWNKQPTDEVISAAVRVFGSRPDMPKPTTADKYAPFLHDAVYLFALALNQSLPYGNATDGSVIFDKCDDRSFKGMTGNVLINSNADRTPAFEIWDLSREGYFTTVTTIQYIRIDGHLYLVVDRNSYIRWGDGSTGKERIPLDEPVCGFNNEKCRSSIDDVLAIAVSSTLSIIMLASIFGFCLLFRWWKKDRDLHNMSWRICFSNIDFDFHKRIRSDHDPVSTNVHGDSTGSMASYTESDILAKSPSKLYKVDTLTTGPQYYTTVARYNENIVAIHHIRKHKLKVDKVFLEEIQTLLGTKHNNLASFIGVCPEPYHVSAVWEYCNKGSVQDVLANDNMKIDTIFQFSIAVDICSGLDYIHSCAIKIHGGLKSTNCLVDSRWICKITDFGLSRLKHGQSADRNKTENQKFEALYWTAPEILRKRLEGNRRMRSQEGDIYALGIILKEIMCRNSPYAEDEYATAKDIVYEVAKADKPVPKRPAIGNILDHQHHSRSKLLDLIHSCWAEQPEQRPGAKRVLKLITRFNPFRKTNVMDNMLAMMEKYSNNLEELVTERTLQLEAEKRKTDALLYRMLPRQVADDLKSGNVVQAVAFESVTIYFSDIVGFTSLAADSSPMEIVELLNCLYNVFDEAIQPFDVYKVETIGDAYMVVSGLPVRNGDKHVKEMCDVALNLLKVVISFQIPHKPERQLRIRIGLHTGSVVAGVVGSTMPRYCLFGDTVNTASRMESSGHPLRIHISTCVAEKIQNDSRYFIKSRGEIDIKGKGKMMTFWLTGKLGIYQEIDEETTIANIISERNNF